MRPRVLGLVCLFILAVSVPGCRKLSSPAAGPDALTPETLASNHEVPASWGRLVSVSNAAQYPDLVQLWFEDETGAVRLVVLRLSSGELVNARRIARS